MEKGLFHVETIVYLYMNIYIRGDEYPRVLEWSVVLVLTFRS
jgi:hypothetical protein